MKQDLQNNLIRVFQQLSAADQLAVSNFAEFLLSRSPDRQSASEVAAAAPAPLPEPNPIPRPDNEKVVAAVKRLSQTYFMLDKTKMLAVTSDLVTQHILHGREAVEVINELEQVFESQYQQLKQGES